MNQKRKIILVIAMMVLSLVSPAYGKAQTIPQERQLPRLVDEGDLLSASEESQLLTTLDEMSERHQCDVAVVTVKSLEGKKETRYADDFYDFNGYGMGDQKSGILLLVSMDERKWAISTYGKAISAFTDSGLSYMEDRFQPLLTAGDYAEAFTVFAQMCDDYIAQATAGDPYDAGNMPKESFPFLTRFLMSLLVGAIVAFITVSSMKAKLKSVGFQKSAAAYEKPGSMHVTKKKDLFLYRNISKRRKPKQNSGGSSRRTGSSGRSHGGSSGSF